MKKRILALLVCGILCVVSITGCSGENGTGSEIVGESSYSSENSGEVGGEEVHNTTKYINDSQDKSKDKMAFIYGDVIITIDYEGIYEEKLVWGGDNLHNDVISVQEYTSGDISVNVSDISLLAGFSADRLEDHELITSDGRWVLRQGNMSDTFVADYVYRDEEYTYRAISFDIFNADSKEVAKERLDKIKSIVNIYFPSNSYIDVKDIDGNSVSLAEYNFLQDIIADIIAEECNMYIADAKTVVAFDNSECIHIDIPDENVEYVDYEIEYRANNWNDDKTPTAEFTLNGKQAKVYEEKEEVFVEMGENSFLRFDYDVKEEKNLEEGTFKDLFIKHFQ